MRTEDQKLPSTEKRPTLINTSIILRITICCTKYRWWGLYGIELNNWPANQRTRKIRNSTSNVLQQNGCKSWMFATSPVTTQEKENRRTEQVSKTETSSHRDVGGMSGYLQRIFKSHRVNIYHKPYNTIGQQLVRQKDKEPLEKRCGVICLVTHEPCSKEHIGETARPLSSFNQTKRTWKKPTSSDIKNITPATELRPTLQGQFYKK